MEQDGAKPVQTRRVVDHVVLFKTTESLTDEQEKVMLDGLWTLQYQIKNVLSTSVGRLIRKTPEGYSHALFSRFPTKDALHEYLEHPIRLKVAEDLVIPFLTGILMADFETDVEDDEDKVCRRGHDFEQGLEHFTLIKFKDSIPSDVVDKFVKDVGLQPETLDYIVQLTIGEIYNAQFKEEFSHAVVGRFPSEEAYLAHQQGLMNDPKWVKSPDLFEKFLTADYLVTPIGKTGM